MGGLSWLHPDYPPWMGVVAHDADGYVARRRLDVDLEVGVIPLTYGRARVVVGEDFDRDRGFRDVW